MVTASPLAPSSFHDPAVFEAEQSLLFEKTWQLAGLGHELRNDKDFITGTIGAQPFVVQNFRGRLAALHNVCSHRAVPMQPTERGNRGLHCPYHGWTYDPRGVPIGIPHNDAYYPLSSAEAQCLAAKSFSLTALGNLVFVSAAPEAPLPSQLGEHYDLLTNIGNALDDICFHTRIQANCNWKFLLHNAYDDIHAQFVHPRESLDTTTTVSTRWQAHPFDAGNERIPQNYSRRHALFTVTSTEAARLRNQAAFDGSFADPVFAFDHYLHLVLFPNLLITSVQGLWYNIVRYRPTSPQTSAIDLWIVPGRQRDGRSRVIPEMLYRLALATLRIFQEDIEAVEYSQRGIASVRRPMALGQREDKLQAFDAACASVLSRAGLKE